MVQTWFCDPFLSSWCPERSTLGSQCFFLLKIAVDGDIVIFRGRRRVIIPDLQVVGGVSGRFLPSLPRGNCEVIQWRGMSVLQIWVTCRPSLHRPLPFSPWLQKSSTIAWQNSLVPASRSISIDAISHIVTNGSSRGNPWRLLKWQSQSSSAMCTDHALDMAWVGIGHPPLHDHQNVTPVRLWRSQLFHFTSSIGTSAQVHAHAKPKLTNLSWDCWKIRRRPIDLKKSSANQ